MKITTVYFSATYTTHRIVGHLAKRLTEEVTDTLQEEITETEQTEIKEIVIKKINAPKATFNEGEKPKIVAAEFKNNAGIIGATLI